MVMRGRNATDTVPREYPRRRRYVRKDYFMLYIQLQDLAHACSIIEGIIEGIIDTISLENA